METSEISFCSKTSLNVNSESTKSEIIKLLENYDIGIKKKRAYIVNEKTVNNICKNDHYVSTRTKGNSYYLFLTNMNSVNYCFFIDKKINDGYKYPRIITTKFRFSNELFKGTLFDGEMVKKIKKWEFLIDDILVYNNRLVEVDLSERINLLNQILINNYEKDEFIDICDLKIKKYFCSNEIEYLLNTFIKNLDYECKGIYITPEKFKYSKLLYIFDESIKKNHDDEDIIRNIEYKPDSYVIFRMDKTDKPDIYDLYTNKAFYDIAYIPKMKQSKQLKKLYINNQSLLFKCNYSIEYNKWIPIEEIESGNIDTHSTIKKYEEKVKSLL